jgi:poly(glycerol-phosphate) alpha-glucosyltransferase
MPASPESPLAPERTSAHNVAARPLRPIFVVGGLYSLANGVAWIMRDLAAALGRAGAPVTVLGADCYGRGATSIGHIFEPPSRWVSRKGLWLGGLSWSPSLKPVIADAVAGADVVHNHSLWMLPNSYSSRAAHRLNRPVVITAHGTLEPWALRHSGWKKRLVGWMFQAEDLRRADCLHVNTVQEIPGIRSFGLTCPIAVIPNGIHLADLEPLPQEQVFRSMFPDTRGRRIALFLGRLHQKKGLEHLVQAWARVAEDFPEWILVIAGPDNGFESTVRTLIAELCPPRSVCLSGALHGEQKRAALAAAECFVHPSFSEGFSMSILEALACRLPVLLTPGCNFPEATAAGAAIEVAPTAEATEIGLRELLGHAASVRAEMGRRGRLLVESRYTWDGVAQDTLKLYRWLMGGEPVPEFVIQDV